MTIPRSREHRVLVVGAGVSGLTSALCLARAGFEVEVVADRFAPDVVSVVAGALWEWPPAVCGHHRDQASLARSKDWCMVSYEIFDDLARDPQTGVFMRTANFYFRHRLEERPRELRKMWELASRVRGFVRDIGLAYLNGVDSSAGIRDAYAHLAPMIDTDRYMAWLRRRVEDAGVRIHRRRIEGRLSEQEVRLQQEFGVAAIVNCAGLGAIELHGASMYALRGALVHVRNDGRRMPRVDEAHCVSPDEQTGDSNFIFIVPRGRDVLALGGLAEIDEHDLDVGLHDHPPIRDMYERCVAFLPALREAELVSDDPVRVGLRPFRRANVCLEREPGTRIIHNYAHGGAGFTFSWGCAHEVTERVRDLGADLWDPVLGRRESVVAGSLHPAPSLAVRQSG
jgi:D-amino-acid oxidase